MVLITKRQSSLMGENKFVTAICAGVSSFPARTKRLLVAATQASAGPAPMFFLFVGEYVYVLLWYGFLCV